MFYHRVLPFPSIPNADPLVAGSRAFRRDSLIEYKIMPSEDSRDNADKHSHNRKTSRALSNLRISEAKNDSGSADREERTPTTPGHALRSSARLGRKRAASSVSDDDAPLESEPKRNSLTVQVEGRGSKSAAPLTPSQISPSKTCLCQPAPKIPRPRNGKSGPILH